MRWMLGPILLGAIVGYGCSECEISRDCDPDFECKAGRCEPAGPPPVIVVTPAVDAGFPDAATSSTADAGFTPDASDLDGGVSDAGAPDGGLGDIDASVGRGTIVIAEHTEGQSSRFTARASIVDERTATYDEAPPVTYPDLEGGNCTLNSRTLVSGAPTGFEAESIQMTLDTGRIVTLEAKGNGQFGLPMGVMLPRALFANPAMMSSFDLTATPSATSLQPFGPVTLPTPTPLVSFTPMEGSQITLGASFSWAVTGQATPVVLEVYDLDRNHVLRCLTTDDGSYQIPAAAAIEYQTRMPTDPVYIELRRDQETMVEIVAPGQGRVPVLIRTSWAPRWFL